MYSMMFGSASSPVSRPPVRPATPCVYTTPSVSSTRRKPGARLRKRIAIHTIVEATTPMTIAP